MFGRLRNLLGKPTTPGDPRDLFATEAERIARSLSGVTQVKRVANAFALELTTTSGAHRFNLDNAFAETREVPPDQRPGLIALYLASAGGALEDASWEDAVGTFVPVIRGATYGIELSAQKPDVAFVRRPFLPYVDVVVAMDHPTSMSYVSRRTVDGWGVSDDELFAAADARSPLLANPALELYDETHGPLWTVSTNDTYETSRLVLPGWLASFKGKVEGNPIAIIPERATLMVGGDGRPEMIERLLDKAEREFKASTRRISPAIYTVDDAGKVIPYVRPVDDPLATKIRLAHEGLALNEYGTQKEALDKIFERSGPDVFLSGYLVFEGPDGTLRSRSIWPRGVRTYLPRTERVLLGVPGEGDGAKPKALVDVPFEVIEERLSRVADLHPARFDTTGEFPNDEELGALAGASG